MNENVIEGSINKRISRILNLTNTLPQQQNETNTRFSVQEEESDEEFSRIEQSLRNHRVTNLPQEDQFQRDETQKEIDVSAIPKKVDFVPSNPNVSNLMSTIEQSFSLKEKEIAKEDTNTTQEVVDDIYHDFRKSRIDEPNFEEETESNIQNTLIKEKEDIKKLVNAQEKIISEQKTLIIEKEERIQRLDSILGSKNQELKKKAKNKDRISKLKATLASEKRKNTSLAIKCKRLEKELEIFKKTTTKSSNQYLGQIKKNEKRINQLIRVFSKSKKKLIELSKELKGEKEKNTKLNEENERLTNLIVKKNKDIKEEQNKVAELKKENTKFLENNKSNLQNTHVTIEAMKEKLRGKDDEMIEFLKDYKKLEDQVAEGLEFKKNTELHLVQIESLLREKIKEGKRQKQNVIIMQEKIDQKKKEVKDKENLVFEYTKRLEKQKKMMDRKDDKWKKQNQLFSKKVNEIAKIIQKKRK